jgi:hypothetical protein
MPAYKITIRWVCRDTRSKNVGQISAQSVVLAVCLRKVIRIVIVTIFIALEVVRKSAQVHAHGLRCGILQLPVRRDRGGQRCAIRSTGVETPNAGPTPTASLTTSSTRCVSASRSIAHTLVWIGGTGFQSQRIYKSEGVVVNIRIKVPPGLRGIG